MKIYLEPIPTIIEAKNLEKLKEIQEYYDKAKKNNEIPFKTSFMVLKSKENDFVAYFHDASKSPTLKETVEWMEQTDNLSFPGNVSILNGIKNRYDEKFHSELDVVIADVMDAFIHRSKLMEEIMNTPELMKIIDLVNEKFPNPPVLSKAKLK